MNIAGFESSPRSLVIKLVGVGGAGSQAVAQMLAGPISGIPALLLHTNAKVNALQADAEKMILGKQRMHGLGTGGDPDIARAAAEDEETCLTKFLQGADLVFVVAGLGGGTGTGAAPVIARLARAQGALVLGLVTLPFQFEGSRRLKQAQEGLHKLRRSADAVICLPNQKFFSMIDEKTGVADTFRLSNELMSQGVVGIWQMLTRKSLIPLDFAYLRSVVGGQNAESSFASAEARGEARTRDVVEKLAASPLLDQGRALEQATDVLVSLVGGDDLSISEVEKVMEQLTRLVPNGQVIMGAALDPSLTGRISLTVVVSKRAPAINALTKSSADETADGLTNRCGEIENSLLNPAQGGQRPVSRYIAPPPETTIEGAEKLMQSRPDLAPTRRKKRGPAMQQGQLNFQITSRGRFEKSEPTIHEGEDLDIPTYVRRGIALN